MAKKYLDYDGLLYLWGKIKNYIDTHGGGGGGDMYKSTYDTDDDGVVDYAEALKNGTETATLDSSGNLTVSGNVNNVDLSKVLIRGHFVAEDYTPSSVTVAANTDSGEKTMTISKSGYYPVAIVGFNMTGTNRMYQNIYECILTSKSSGSATVTYRFRNNANAQVTVAMRVTILWIKVL